MVFRCFLCCLDHAHTEDQVTGIISDVQSKNDHLLPQQLAVLVLDLGDDALDLVFAVLPTYC